MRAACISLGALIGIGVPILILDPLLSTLAMMCWLGGVVFCFGMDWRKFNRSSPSDSEEITEGMVDAGMQVMFGRPDLDGGNIRDDWRNTIAKIYDNMRRARL